MQTAGNNLEADFNNLVSDVDDWKNKPYLVVAVISHLRYFGKYPKDVVTNYVHKRFGLVGR